MIIRRPRRRTDPDICKRCGAPLGGDTITLVGRYFYHPECWALRDAELAAMRPDPEAKTVGRAKNGRVVRKGLAE